MHKQNEKFNREIEIMKKNQAEILEMKNTMNEILKSNRDHRKQNNSRGRKKTCELEDRTFEIFHSRRAKNK